MFGFNKSKGTVVEEIPTAVSPHPTMPDEIRAQYIEKARALGVVNGALKEEMLLAFLRENGIRVYPLEKVREYLDGVFGKVKNWDPPTWVWRPLRDDDDGKLQSNHDSRNGRIVRGVYQQAIPFPVLLTIEKIISIVPDVHFYVSDRSSSSKDEDPFLAVTTAGMDMLVIERWDEPTFRA